MARASSARRADYRYSSGYRAVGEPGQEARARLAGLRRVSCAFLNVVLDVCGELFAVEELGELELAGLLVPIRIQALQVLQGEGEAVVRHSQGHRQSFGGPACWSSLI